MELNRVKILANRYFDGVTSRAEEQELREALRSIDNLDDELRVLKAMLDTMDSLHETTSPVKVVRPTISRRVVWLGRVASVAIAACAIFGIFLGINHREQSIVESPTIICHINGELVSDQTIARAEMDRVLGGVADNMALTMAKIEKLNLVRTE